MNPDDIAAELPAPRDDEPESLRQDIVDELADHLQCALHRELLAGGHSSPSQQASPRRESGDSDIEHTACQHPQADAWGSPVHAWQQVLTRFGNPATIARRLWFDAMKERLMAQKTMAAALVLAAVALCVMTAMTWSRSREDRQFLLESFAANREMMQQMSQLQEQILQDSRASQEALKSLATTDTSNPEWVQGEVFVYLDSLDGQPAAGIDVTVRPPYGLGGGGHVNPDLMGATATTDAQGRADLGLLHVGNYQLRIKSPGGDFLRDEVTIYPGKPFSTRVAMPAGERSPVQARVRTQWPEGFDPQHVWVQLWPYGLDHKLDDRTWYPRDPDFYTGFEEESPYAYLISPDGTVYAVAEVHKHPQNNVSSITWFAEDAKPLETVTLPGRGYRFSSLSFLVDAEKLKVANWSNDGLPTRKFVPDTYLNDGQEFQELTGDADPVLTITIPPSVVDAIEDFRDEVRDPDDTASAVQATQ